MDLANNLQQLRLLEKQLSELLAIMDRLRAMYVDTSLDTYDIMQHYHGLTNAYSEAIFKMRIVISHQDSKNN